MCKMAIIRVIIGHAPLIAQVNPDLAARITCGALRGKGQGNASTQLILNSHQAGRASGSSRYVFSNRQLTLSFPSGQVAVQML